MKTRTVAVTLAMFVVSVTLCFAENPMMGTWKLNEAKSKLGAGAAKNTTVVYEASGDSIKCTIDGTDRDGKPTHNEWTGKFDGKDYPLSGDSGADMRAYKKINDRTFEGYTKKGGRVLATSKIAVSADGKTRTVKTDATDASGKKVHSVAFYDKQ